MGREGLAGGRRVVGHEGCLPRAAGRGSREKEGVARTWGELQVPKRLEKLHMTLSKLRPAGRGGRWSTQSTGLKKGVQSREAALDPTERTGGLRESQEKKASSPGGRRSPTQCAGLGEELLAQEAPFKGKPALAPLLEHAQTLRHRSLSRPPEDTCLKPDSPVNPLNQKQTQRLQR